MNHQMTVHVNTINFRTKQTLCYCAVVVLLKECWKHTCQLRVFYSHLVVTIEKGFSMNWNHGWREILVGAKGQIETNSHYIPTSSDVQGRLIGCWKPIALWTQYYHVQDCGLILPSLAERTPFIGQIFGLPIWEPLLSNIIPLYDIIDKCIMRECKIEERGEGVGEYHIVNSFWT